MKNLFLQSISLPICTSKVVWADPPNHFSIPTFWKAIVSMWRNLWSEIMSCKSPICFHEFRLGWNSQNQQIEPHLEIHPSWFPQTRQQGRMSQLLHRSIGTCKRNLKISGAWHPMYMQPNFKSTAQPGPVSHSATRNTSLLKSCEYCSVRTPLESSGQMSCGSIGSKSSLCELDLTMGEAIPTFFDNVWYCNFSV